MPSAASGALVFAQASERPLHVVAARDGATIVIRNVPANVCGTGGEDYLDAAAASSLETVLQEAARSGVRFEVREYQAA